MAFRKAYLVLGLVATLPLVACDVDQTEEGDLPEVNVEGGELPQYDVQTGDVDLETDTATITVPDVDVDMPDDEPGTR